MFVLALVAIKVIEIAAAWGVAANLIARFVRSDNLPPKVNAGITLVVGVVTAALLAYANSGAVLFAWAPFWDALSGVVLGMIGSHELLYKPFGVGDRVQTNFRVPVVKPVLEKVFGPKAP